MIYWPEMGGACAVLKKGDRLLVGDHDCNDPNCSCGCHYPLMSGHTTPGQWKAYLARALAAENEGVKA